MKLFSGLMESLFFHLNFHSSCHKQICFPNTSLLSVQSYGLKTQLHSAMIYFVGIKVLLIKENKPSYVTFGLTKAFDTLDKKKKTSKTWLQENNFSAAYSYF